MAKEQQNTAPDAQPAKPAATGKDKKKKEFKKKKERRTVPHGLAHISASFNNTQITITDPDGRVICNSSAGSIGFKGSRKGTPYAAQQASLTAASAAQLRVYRAFGVSRVILANQVTDVPALRLPETHFLCS